MEPKNTTDEVFVDDGSDDEVRRLRSRDGSRRRIVRDGEAFEVRTRGTWALFGALGPARPHRLDDDD